jgi:hypothetical protein
MRSRDEIKTAIQNRLRREFPSDTVDVTDGYQDNIHVLVVSRKFDPMKERVKQDLLWSLIDDAGLEEAEKQLISLILPVSPDEIRP